ncbi:hypothetical protein PENARI_c004G12007 [Penicillium arizonense]|uniref:ferric-chelate reductase (NADPH) n=1 Tax=Penicillium arizonense TaxID=1835702 RepID=A0A1F5LR24_PENAI|nr:hypothetical protein PENARI_c004G12007 [Penicillium arizonense]OGE55399.1 hypothetical protein PENARI_c004G12007 [Penicillium arizonense]
MAIFQSVLHIILSIQISPFDLREVHQKNGLIAMVSIGVSTLAVVPFIRRHAYEVCMKLHLSIGVFAVVMVWIHMKDRYGLNGKLLISAIGLLIINTMFYGARELFRNITRSQVMAVAQRTPLAGAVRLDFTPPRPWEVHAGDYVYLRAPGVHPLSFAESHPFNIIWWDQDKSGRASRIQLISRVHSGFTKDLSAISHGSLRVLVDGPYGKALNTRYWDNFLFVATDIGISAQMPYLKELIDLQRHPRRLSRVSIIWVVEDDQHRDWVTDEVQHLLDVDAAYMLFHWTTYSKTKIDTTYVARRGRMVFGNPHMKTVLEEEFGKFSGNVLLSGETTATTYLDLS